jgi:flavodoxin
MNRNFLLTMLMALLTSIQLSAYSTNNTDDERMDKKAAKMLIVYYSWSNNTRKIANEIHSIVGGDMIEITLTTPYAATTDQQLYPIAQEELRAIDNNGIYPSISTVVENLADYDTVFVGYPLWYSRMATPMQAFLHTHGSQLADKTIVLFCTSASSGISGTIADARRLCPDAGFTEALWIRASLVDNSRGSIVSWLQSIGMDGTTGTIQVKANETQIVTEQTQIHITGEFTAASIWDINGRFIAKTNKRTIDTSKLPSGFYLVIVDTGTRSIVKKIIK